MGGFEENLKKLEDIVSKLEKGEGSLEESVEMFEEGIRLTGELEKTLDAAEGKIRMVTASGIQDFENKE